MWQRPQRICEVFTDYKSLRSEFLDHLQNILCHLLPRVFLHLDCAGRLIEAYWEFITGEKCEESRNVKHAVIQQKHSSTIK